MKNANLWKRILHNGITAPDSLKGFQHEVIRAPIIASSRISIESDNYDFRWRDYKGLAIPFINQSFWIDIPSEDGSGIGALVHVTRKNEIFVVAIWGVAVIGDRPTVVCEASFRISPEGNLITGPAPEFAMMRLPTRLFVNPSEYSLDRAASRNRTLNSMIGDTYCDEVLYILQMLSCKNVSLSPRDNDPKQVRIATKRHGPSNTGYRYHVLTVRPPGAKSDSPGVDIGTMPRHVCRGHFSEYGPEYGKGLLFGKLSGRFFIPPHVRGDKKNGIVEKDYEIPAMA